MEDTWKSKLGYIKPGHSSSQTRTDHSIYKPA